MPPPVQQEFLEDALATWGRLRQWTELNNYICALRSPPFYRQSLSESDPYSLRLARRVVEVTDRLAARADAAVDDDVTPRGELLALAADVALCLSPLPAPAPATAAGHRNWEPRLVSAEEPPSSFATSSPSPGTVTTATAHSRGDWAAAVARRAVPGTAMMEGLHVLTCPSVQLRINMAVARLRERVKEELVGSIEWEALPHTPKELRALRATSLLLDDFEALYQRLLATFPCARAMGSAHVPVALLPVIHEQFYQMAEWVLETELTATSKPGSHVKAFEPNNMHVMMLRPDPTSPWGVRFNSSGRITGVSAMVRSASGAGERLHQLLQETKGGVAVVSYNLKPVDFTKLDAAQAAETFCTLSPRQTRLYLKLKVDLDLKPSVEQLAFFTGRLEPSTQQKELHEQQQQKQQKQRKQEEKKQKQKPQQSEPERPQCATLVLHRDDYNVSWEVAITRDLRVMNVPTNILSKEAENFFAAYPRQVRIGGINGVAVESAVQVEALSSVVNTLVLDLHCIPPPPLPQVPLQEEDQAKENTTKNLNSVSGDHTTQKKQQPQPQQPVVKETISASEHASHLQSEREKQQQQKREATYNKTAKMREESEEEQQLTKQKQRRQQRHSSSSVQEGNESSALESDAAQDRTPSASSHSIIRKDQSGAELPYAFMRKAKAATKTTTMEVPLSDADIAALREKPLVPMHMMNAKAEGAVPWQAVIPSLDGDTEDVRVSCAEDGEAAPCSPSDATAAASSEAVTPLVLPNDVTLDLLTLDEMVLRRHSADRKWGLSLETVGHEPNKTIRIVSLPLVADVQRQRLQKQHPFYRLFLSHKGDWRILSVNGTPASRLPEVLDVMKHALLMQIKFHRLW
ncbi:hypothetical protein DQ04_08181020 [Trypanosoma grayi]|uniref:hypothetical protein n=1 Tax=Trypanosoma grayi TaxID=71804 RepID=UPI0004F45FC3|nr:hypothetical protein DQ04_08181020 [Trypanosoma grayi]KEG08032.1 hypothetical protein DQ04_08181020 [Trypanosoma grayi]